MSRNSYKELSDVGAVFYGGGGTGTSVSNAGDVNADGISDVIMMAPFGYNSGSSFVVYGQKGGLPNINLGWMNASQGFQIFGTSYDIESSTSVSGAGDINADGISDIIIGDPRANSNIGMSYVIYGQKGGLDSFNISSLTHSQGFRIFGLPAYFVGSGISVSGAGDINADGIDDIIISTNDPAYKLGAAYVIYGKKGGLADIHLANLIPSHGFQIFSGSSAYFGVKTVSTAGDINADGIDDIIIGNPEFSYDDAGASYVIYGQKGGLADICLSNFTSSQGFAILGYNGYTGLSVSGAGDVNADGISDVIIGACINYFATGYVIYGQKGGVPNIDLSNYNPNQGFEIFGTNYSSCDGSIYSSGVGGVSVSGAGDVNDDGIDDIILGASGSRQQQGVSYVIYGQKGGLENIDVGGMVANQGFKIVGAYKGDDTGWSISSAGDVNADGIDDIIIGAPAMDSNSGGNAYVVYGHVGEINNVYLADFQ